MEYEIERAKSRLQKLVQQLEPEKSKPEKSGLFDRETHRQARQTISQEKARTIARSCELTPWRNLSPKSQAEYARKAGRLAGTTPSAYCREHNLSKSAWNVYKAAAQHLYKIEVETLNKELDKARKRKERPLVEHLRTELAESVQALQNAQNDTYTGQKKALSKKSLARYVDHNGPDPGREKWLEKSQTRQNRKSKRGILKKLDKNWMLHTQKFLPPEYQKAGAISHLTGARPGEIEKGVKCRLEYNTLLIEIEGGKQTKDGLRGQEWRRLELDAINPDIQPYINILFEGKKDGQIHVDFSHTNAKNKANAYSKAYERASFKGTGIKKVTPYTARHEIATRLKTEGLSADFIAQAMGHQGQKSQLAYGSFSKGRGGSGITNTQAKSQTREYKYQYAHTQSHDRGMEM